MNLGEDLLDLIDEAVVFLNETLVVKVNFSARKYGFEEGRDILEVFSSSRMDELVERILNKESFTLEERVYFFESGHRNVKITYLKGWLILKDVTEVATLREAKKDFVIAVSHELFNPIAALKGNISILKEMELPEGARETVESLARAVKRVERIVQQLKMVAMAQLGLYEVRKMLVAPRKVLEEVLTDLSQKIEAKKIRVVHDIEIDGIFSDPFVLFVIMKNLISNAVKYSYPNSEIKVKITKEELVVEDQGIGIREEEKNRIFNRFYRGKDAAKMAPGSGLGLSVVKHLCALMGYGLSFESDWMVGSKFKVTFNG